MATRTVTISLLEQTPKARTIRFTPDLASVNGEVLVSKRYKVTTDANGDGSIALPVKTSGNIRYEYEIPREGGYDRGSFVLAAGSAVSLDVLIAAGGSASDNTIDYIEERLLTVGATLAKATGAEVNTGTNDAKYLTPKAIEDSAYVKAAFVASSLNFLNVQDYGAVGDGTTDDYAAITACIAAAIAGHIKIVWFPSTSAYYKYGTPLDLRSTNGITLLGHIGNRTLTEFSGLTTRLVYSGTAAAAILTAQSEALSIIGLACQYSNAAFTGDVLTTGGYGAPGEYTQSPFISDCMFGGTGPTIRGGRSGLHLSGAVQPVVQRSYFQWADWGILCVAAGDDIPLCTAATIGPSNWFGTLNEGGVAPNNTSQTNIIYNVFEPIYPGYNDGAAGGIFTQVEGGGGLLDGLNIIGNGFWDSSSSTPGTWIDLYGRGVNIQNNYFTVFSAQTAIKLKSGGGPYTITGNSCAGTLGGKFLDIQSNIVDPLIFSGNNIGDVDVVPITGGVFARYESQTFKYLTTNGGARLLGYTSSASTPTTTELPNSLDWCLHNNTTGPTIYLAFNIGGVIKKVALS